jgi:hypothetical protein
MEPARKLSGKLRGRAAIRTGTPFGIDGVAALGAMMRRNDPRRRLFEPRPIGPIHAGEQAGFASRRLHRSRTVRVGHVVMALIFFKKPAARKSIPADRNDPPAFRLDFIPDPILVDEVHDDPKGQSRDDREQQKRKIHGAIVR